MSEVISRSPLVIQDQAITATASSSNEHRVEEITAEILQQKNQIVHSFIQIGKLLDEARGPLKKEGQWLKWLDRVGIPERMAQRYIQLAKAFPDPTSVSGLGMTKALALLALPEAQRDAFINEPHEINGEQKMVGDMSVREIRHIVREKTKPSEESVKGTAESHDVTATTEEIGTASPKSCEGSKKSGMIKPIWHNNAMSKSEVQSVPSAPDELISDIESAQTRLDGILKILESQAADDIVQNRIADKLHSLHEKVKKCLSLVGTH